MSLGINASSRWTRAVLAAAGLLAVLWALAVPRLSVSDKEVMEDLSRTYSEYEIGCYRQAIAKAAMATHSPMYVTPGGEKVYATEADLTWVERSLTERDALREKLSLTRWQRSRLSLRVWDRSALFARSDWSCDDLDPLPSSTVP